MPGAVRYNIAPYYFQHVIDTIVKDKELGPNGMPLVIVYKGNVRIKRDNIRSSLTIQIVDTKKSSKELKDAEAEIDKIVENLAKATDLKVPWWYYKGTGTGAKDVGLPQQQNAKVDIGYVDNQVTGNQPKAEFDVMLDKVSYSATFIQGTKDKGQLEPKDTKGAAKKVEIYRQFDKIEDHTADLSKAVTT
jgi:hypothetical protein